MTPFAARAIGATLAATLAFPALAQATIEPAYSAAPSPYDADADWTGGYAGVKLGYGELSDGVKGDGMVAALSAGYKMDLGEWVVGGGADINFSNIDTNAGDLGTVSRLIVQGGYDFGRNLVYLSTGASYIEGEDLGNSWGYFGGLGLETMVTDSVSIVGELTGYRFGDFDHYGDVDASTATIGLNYRF